MDCCECGGGLKKVSKLAEDLGESIFNKTNRTNPRAMNKLKHRGSFGDGPVWYDKDGTHCDDTIMDNLNRRTGLALEVYNNTQATKYNLVELVRATGHISAEAGSMVDLIFTANRQRLKKREKRPKTFRARVSFTHEYVESVGF